MDWLTCAFYLAGKYVDGLHMLHMLRHGAKFHFKLDITNLSVPNVYLNWYDETELLKLLNELCLHYKVY